MQILKVTDEAFRQYGKVIKDLDVSDIITAMSETPCPDDVVYEPSIKASKPAKAPSPYPTASTAACRSRSATATATTIY